MTNDKTTQPREQADERALFEAWAVDPKGGNWMAAAMRRYPEGHSYGSENYIADRLQEEWKAWQARAALGTRQAAPEAPTDDRYDARRAAVIHALSHHRMVRMYEVEDDGLLGNSYPLIDRLCLDDGRDIESGPAEVEAIADTVLRALEKVK